TLFERAPDEIDRPLDLRPEARCCAHSLETWVIAPRLADALTDRRRLVRGLDARRVAAVVALRGRRHVEDDHRVITRELGLPRRLHLREERIPVGLRPIRRAVHRAAVTEQRAAVGDAFVEPLELTLHVVDRALR